ncbi:MAG: serine/threonine-protein phosphatase [Armatimonadetes bacterium]|nr:serine/threonine-protein phosphatase [Armatimonadota bacterium]
MSPLADSLREGAIIAGRYQIRRTLASDSEARLLVAVDDGGPRPELRVLLTRPANSAPDLRQAADLASAGSLCAPLVDSLEVDGQQVLVLGANGGLTLADPSPSANDPWLAHVLLVLTQLLSDLARAGADLDQVTLARLVLVPGEPGLRYVGPVVAGAATDLPAALARLRDDLLAQPGTWSSDLRAFIEHWRHGRLGSFSDVLTHLAALCEPGELTAQVGLVSDAGRIRRQNEDAALRLAEQSLTGLGAVEWSLVALADGMGGHRGGRQASQLALHTLATSLAWQGANAAMEGHSPRWDDNGSVVALLLAAVDEAHRAVAGLADTGEERAPGCTLTAGLLVDRRFFLVHVGDSRAYLARDGRLEQLTRDDTLVQGLVDGGDLTAAEARSHPSGHVLTQALGQPVAINPMVGLRLLWPGDRLLFCSDGITESLDDAALAALLADPRPAADVAERVVTAALTAGSRDNVTAIVQDLS